MELAVDNGPEPYTSFAKALLSLSRLFAQFEEIDAALGPSVLFANNILPAIRETPLFYPGANGDPFALQSFIVRNVDAFALTVQGNGSPELTFDKIRQHALRSNPTAAPV